MSGLLARDRSKPGLNIPCGQVLFVEKASGAPNCPLSASILYEWCANFISAGYYTSGGYSYRERLINNVTSGHRIYIVWYNAARKIAFGYYDGASDESVYLDDKLVVGGRHRIAFLHDKTHNKAVIFLDGARMFESAIPLALDFSSGNIGLMPIGSSTETTVDVVDELTRMTFLSSVPDDIDQIQLEQESDLMNLHPRLKALAVNLASQWDFEDQQIDSTTIKDHGYIGGQDAVASAAIQPYFCIAEKQRMRKPDKTYYSLDVGHSCSKAYVTNHGMQSGAFLVESLGLSYDRWYGGGGGNITPFYVISSDALHYIQLQDRPDGYRLYIRNAGGYKYYDIPKSLLTRGLGHLIIAIEGTTSTIIYEGQQIYEDLTGRLPDFTSKNLVVNLNTCPAYPSSDASILRVWNYPAGVMPAGWKDIAKYNRMQNVWKRPNGWGVPNLEYLVNSDIAPTSLVIPCTGVAGADGDLTISGSAQFQNARVEVATP